MAIEYKRDYVGTYCEETICAECALKRKNWEHENIFSDGSKCLDIMTATEKELDKAIELIDGQLNPAGSSTENGGDHMEKPVVTINLDRYTELVRKEALLDELMKGRDINVYLYQKVNEPLKEEN